MVLLADPLSQLDQRRKTRIDGFLQFEPRRGEEARERTEALVLYDDTYLYFAFRCYDSNPSTS